MGDEYRVTLEVPGAKNEGLEVRPGPAPGTLSVRARTRDLQMPHGRPLVVERRELPRGEYARVLPVGWDADMDRASATVEDGLLRIVVPKRGSTGAGGASEQKDAA